MKPTRSPPLLVRPVTSTTHLILIFVANGLRLHESIASQRHYGVSRQRQHHLGLPDGELANHIPALAGRIASIVAKYSISTIVSLGIQGYDDHPDHIASFWSAELAAAWLYSRHNYHVGHLALNSQHSGEIVIAGTPERQIRKLGSMACNRSQHDVRPIDKDISDERMVAGYAIGQRFNRAFRTYWPLLGSESYDVRAYRKSAA